MYPSLSFHTKSYSLIHQNLHFDFTSFSYKIPINLNQDPHQKNIDPINICNLALDATVVEIIRCAAEFQIKSEHLITCTIDRIRLGVHWSTFDA